MLARILVLGLVLIGVQAYSQQKILLVGNSLTYTNNLPSLLDEIASMKGKQWETTCLCYPNFGLEDHVHDPTTKAEILSKAYSWVIFQQGPSSQADGRASLLRFGDSLSQWSITGGAKPALFMVWTSLDWAGTWPLVIQNHRDAADQIGAMLIPVGENWQAYLKAFPTDALYTADEFHPSLLGSYLAAASIFQTMDNSLTYDSINVPDDLSRQEWKRIHSILHSNED